MSKRTNLVQIFLFLTFIALFFILNLILPDRDFSEQENRKLTQSPKFSLSSLFAGNFTTTFESYTTDQFAFRDKWISMKASAELASGKHSNNGVFLCEDGTLLEAYEKPDTKDIDSKLTALETLSKNVEVPVYFALIPGASEILSDKLPENAPNDSQLEVIEYAYNNTSLPTIDFYSVLANHSEESIYYKTDHHWTTLGAYYGYTSLANAFNLETMPLSTYNRKTVSNAFYGTLYSSSGFSWVDPDSIEIFADPEGIDVTNYPSGSPVAGTIYDESFLDKKDKYSYFIGGNTPLLQISTENEDAPSLLIVRDSYMDSLIPFLVDDFSELHVIDLRYYKNSLSEYINEHNIDNVLVCYSVANFSTDNSLFLLGR